MISGNRHRWRSATAALALVAAGAAAGAETPAWDIEQLMQGLSKVTAAKGKFVERKYLAMLTAPLDSSGTLVYTAPGRLGKTHAGAQTRKAGAGSGQADARISGPGQRRALVLQNYPVVWAFVESIRSTLAGDYQTLNRFYRASVGGSEEQWRLSLKPVDPKMQSVVQEIRIGGVAQPGAHHRNP